MASRRSGHVDGEAIALLDPHAAQRLRHFLHLVQQMGVGVHATLATFVDVNQRRVPSPTALHMMVERVVGEVGLGPDVPLERRRVPLQYLSHLRNHGSWSAARAPETFRILLSFRNPFLCHRTYQMLRNYGSDMVIWTRARGRHFCCFDCRTHRKRLLYSMISNCLSIDLPTRNLAGRFEPSGHSLTHAMGFGDAWLPVRRSSAIAARTAAV